MITSDYNKSTNNRFDVKITTKKLANESDLKEKIKNISNKRRKKISNKSRLKVDQDTLVKLQRYNLSLFIGLSLFNNDWEQLYLILQPFCYTSKRLGYTEKVVSWKSKDF